MCRSHVTHLNESCHTSEWVILHIWMIHLTHLNESCHTSEWVMSHIWMIHVTHVQESCHTFEWCHTCAWFMLHICISPVTHIHESCHTYAFVMAHIYMSHVTHMKWVTLTWYHVTHLNPWHEPCHTSNRGQFCDWGRAPDFQRPVRVDHRWGFSLFCSLREGDRQTDRG